MGILFLTVKQERCSDSLLWSAAWLLPPLRLMPMLTTATATASATEDSATPVLDMLVSDTATALATATPVLDTLTARGRLRASLRLTLSTDTELTPTLPDTVTPVSATLPPTATATVWEPTELTELTTVKFVQLRAAEAQHSLYRQFSFHRSRTPCAVRRERILFSLIVW